LLILSYGPAERTNCPLGDYGFGNSSDKFCHEKFVQNIFPGPRPPSIVGAYNPFPTQLGYSQGPFGRSSSANQLTGEIESSVYNSLQGNTNESFARSSSTSRLSDVSDDSSFVTNYSTESSFLSAGMSRNTSLNNSDNVPSTESEGPSNEPRHSDSIPVFYSGMSHKRVSPVSESQYNRSKSPYPNNLDRPRPSSSTPLKRSHDSYHGNNEKKEYPYKQPRLDAQPSSSTAVKTATISQPPNDINAESNVSSLFDPNVGFKKEAGHSSQYKANTNKNNSFIDPALTKNRENPISVDGDNDLVYKCDYCRTFFLESGPLEDHLKSCFHVSGSVYEMDNSKTPAEMTLVKMLAVQYPACHLKSCVIICPECSHTFNDIFTCGLHYKYVHSMEEAQYCVARLIDEKTVEISIKPNCSKCSKKFGNHSYLHKHWEEEKSHNPVQLDTSANKINLAVCQDCNKTFTSEFNKALLHVIYSHNKHLPSSKCNTALVMFKEFFRPKKRDTLPPIRHSDRKSISVELDILKLIKAENFKNLKAKSVLIDERIKYLQRELQKDIQ
jgi:hypothetical protein